MQDDIGFGVDVVDAEAIFVQHLGDPMGHRREQIRFAGARGPKDRHRNDLSLGEQPRDLQVTTRTGGLGADTTGWIDCVALKRELRRQETSWGTARHDMVKREFRTGRDEVQLLGWKFVPAVRADDFVDQAGF